MTSWRTVILWGTYEELNTLPEQKKAMKILNDRFLPLRLSESLLQTGYMHFPREVEKARKPVIYRISIDEVSGRFEK
jgi:nitroimidazol reductase NimA-like FMN-containing flavoprotein (pyridoxamine 5'-phosphate oxidase superfamily)